MTDMFLLFEWTEEREAKMHLGIYSSMEKAQAASQVYWEHEQKERGAEPSEMGPVVWEVTSSSLGEEFYHGRKTLAPGADPDLADRNDEECPFDIEKFELDTVGLYTYDFTPESPDRRVGTMSKVSV